MVDPVGVLFAEFVFRRSGRRVPLFPECLNENVSFPVCFELQKNIPFHRGNDVDHFLLKPGPVTLGIFLSYFSEKVCLKEKA
jgi:hypothetical protein